MTKLKIKYQEFETRLHKISIRERAIIMGAMAILILGLVDQFFLQPMMKEREMLEQEKANIQKEMKLSLAMIDQLELVIVNDPNRVRSESIKQLNQQHDLVDKKINAFAEGMVDPKNMTPILAKLLSEENGLKILSVKAIPAYKVLVSDGKDEKSPAIYRHDVELLFSGKYKQVQNYLASVEQLPKSMIWDDMGYRVEAYPEGEFQLRVHTLSAEEEFIRVGQ